MTEIEKLIEIFLFECHGSYDVEKFEEWYRDRLWKVPND